MPVGPGGAEILCNPKTATGNGYLHLSFPTLPIGGQFTLRTDHSAFKWLQILKEPEGQLARWLEQLQKYEFEIIHRGR